MPRPDAGLMTTYIVRVLDREDGLRGVVSEVATGRASTFTDGRTLLAVLAALNGTDPGVAHLDDPEDPFDRSRFSPGETTGSDHNGVGSIDPLTRSQLRVCRLAALGKSNTDIAEELFVSRATVESHLHASYRKLGIASRFALPLALCADVA
jgi:DNA-binding NarL/FixJ family response regulator